MARPQRRAHRSRVSGSRRRRRLSHRSAVGFFSARLSSLQPKAQGARRWVFVAYDQLHDGLGPLSTIAPHELGIVLVESRAKAARRPYHRRKLALVLANLRHFALEQASRGVAVRHVVSDGDYASALASVVGELEPDRGFLAMVPAERELRMELEPLVADGRLRYVPHDGWLTTREDFDASGPPGAWRMDAFYRHVRRRTGILMHGGAPVGGKFSFDAENRARWDGEPEAPSPPTFPVDPVKREVVDLVERAFAHHPGAVRVEELPATKNDAEAQWRFALRACLPAFGPFEDAMSVRSRQLFHTRIAGLLNLHRLLPRRVVDDVLFADLPLPSKEGFIRQVLGWREFVKHVHDATSGLRTTTTCALGAAAPLPPAFWPGAPSGLRCLDHVVAAVWEDGWSHHVTRLMVLANVATLLDVSPRELADWFWVAYEDAYDWVVEPNVLAMGTFATGPVMTTKPYVAGSAYLARMGDYCDGCAFDPRTSCPLTRLYWAFLARHEAALARVPRMHVPLAALRKRTAAQRARDAATFERVRDVLARGDVLTPGASPENAPAPAPRAAPPAGRAATTGAHPTAPARPRRRERRA
jgi:deoxyribodipyrimidine photolyase-related protein